MATNPFLDMVRAQLEMRQRSQLQRQQIEAQKELQQMADTAAAERQRTALEANAPLLQAQTQATQTQAQAVQANQTLDLIKSGFKPAAGQVTVQVGDNTMTAAPEDIITMQEQIASVDARVKEMAQRQMLTALGLDSESPTHRSVFELFNGAVSKIGSPGVDLLTSAALANSLSDTLAETLKGDESPGAQVLTKFANRLRESLNSRAEELLETRKMQAQAAASGVSRERWATEATAHNLLSYLVRTKQIPSEAVSREEQIAAVNRFLQDEAAVQKAAKELGISAGMVGLAAGKVLNNLNAGGYNVLGSVMAQKE